MLCLGIESTAHTLGIGIVSDKGEILANERSVFTTEEGGIHPRKAAQHHFLLYEFVLQRALEKAGVGLRDLDLIAFARGPGLGACLRIGAVAGRSLSVLLKKPLVGVNHCIAHIEVGKLASGFKDPITLYVSGANTQILALAGGRYRVFGETLDIGVGNFLDAFGRALGLGFPAGPEIERLAKKGRKYIELPYTIKGMDFAFSGILTKLESLVRKELEKSEYEKKKREGGKIGRRQVGELSEEFKANLCFSAQETVFAELVEATERAIAHIGKSEILLTGGVAANKRLQQMLRTMARDRGVRFAVVPRELAGDNGAMIAWQGILEFKSRGPDNPSNTAIKQRWRTDEVKVCWFR